MLLIVSMIVIMAMFAILGFKRPGLALTTSPIATVLLMLVSGLMERTEGIVIAPLVFLATLIAILMSGRDKDSNVLPQKTAKWILITFVFFILLVATACLFNALSIYVFAFFAWLTGSLISYCLTSRYTIAAYVISTIGSSMRQNLPLAMALESAAGAETDTRAIILRRIKKWLVQGYSLGESIKRGYPKCPSRAVAMIAAAEKINQLPSAIKAIEADMVAKADENRRIKPVYPLYPIIVITFMFLIVLGLMTYVVPLFANILEEVVWMPLPKATQILMKITDFVAYRYGWLIGPALLLLVLSAFAVRLRTKFRPRRPDRPYLISRIGDFVKWHLPILHWFEKNYSIVQVVELLRLSLKAGSTIDESIANTLSLDVNNCFRKRLRKWLAKVQAGSDISTAAKESKVGSSLAWAFVVGFVAYAMFSPMVLIITRLAGSVMP